MLPDLDSLWDFSDVDGTETRFRDLLDAAEEADRAEILTQLARTMSLRRRFDEAHELLDQAAATMGAGSRAEVRYLLERGRSLNSAGGRHASRQVFAQAIAAAEALGDGHLLVDALHMSAIVEEPEPALELHRRAIATAEASDDPKVRKWRASVANNYAWALFDQGRLDAALHWFERARDFRAEQGQVREEQIARWCIARCLRELGRIEEALQLQSDLAAEVEEPDPYLHEELALLNQARNDREAAARHAAAALELEAQSPGSLPADRAADLARLAGNEPG